MNPSRSARFAAFVAMLSFVAPFAMCGPAAAQEKSLKDRLVGT